MKHLLNTIILLLALLMQTTAASNDFCADNIKNTIFAITTNAGYLSTSYGEALAQADSSIIVFTDATVKAICIQNWDTNGDGELSKAEAAAVNDLNDVFRGNSSITLFDELQYFSGLTAIGNHAFEGCISLTHVKIPNSVTTIGDYAFNICNRLMNIGIPNSVTTIGESAFRYCDMTSLIIPNSVTSIGLQAFSHCSKLANITVNSGNTVYDSRDHCNAIIETASNTLIVGCKNSVIPNSITTIGESAFFDCSELTNIDIPRSVTNIGIKAFGWCRSLTSIEIPNSVTNIGIGAFEGCSGLMSIYIPNSVVTIETGVFACCNGLINITVDPANTVFDSRNSCNAIIKSATNALIAGCKNSIIPNSVINIRDYAFYGCSELVSIEIPNSVEFIGTSAFESCSSLASIGIPNTIFSISSSAFRGCKSLTSIVIPNSVRIIGHFAFDNCSSLTSVVIPCSVAHISDRAFGYCPELKDVYSYITDLSEITMGDNIFYHYTPDYSGRTLHVPAGTLASYQADSRWSDYFGNIVVMGEAEGDSIITFADANVKAICVQNWDTNGDGELGRAEAAAVTSLKMFFNANNTITSFDELQFFHGLTSIGGSAFTSCSKLISVTFPNSITTIGNYAFSGTGLKSINIPNSVTSIGIDAFSNCKDLTSITVNSDNVKYDSRNNCNAIIETATNTLISGCQNTIIPNSVTSIGDYAFHGCKGMTEVTIPNSVTIIGKGAFYGCFELSSVNLPNSVTSIGMNSFSNTGLTSVEIPNSVTSIDRYAFQSCWRLKSVTIPNSIIEISDGVFWNCKNLRDVYSYIQDLSQVTVGDNLFMVPVSQGTFNYSGRTLHVPAGTLAAYQADNNWYPYFGQIVDDLNPVSPLGDVNGDHEVNIADINAIIGIILGGNSGTDAADVNGDGEINIADVNAIISIILGHTTPAPNHEYVDLGLPSGTLWASCNVGASSPEEYGDHFAWGETVPKDYYDWSTYKWCNGDWNTLTKYCTNSSNGTMDNKIELEPTDDAAYINWGELWRMPTREQQLELINYCTWNWASLKGVNGYQVIGPNGASLFLPAAGDRWDDLPAEPGSFGGYWSRTIYINGSYYAYTLCFSYPLYVSEGLLDRCYGHTVRPVRISRN